MLRWWKRKPKIAGYIGYFGLQDWWLSALTEEERAWAESTYSPMGSSMTLTKGHIITTSQDCVGFLSSAAPWFSKPGHHKVAIAFADKLAEIVKSGDETAQHFAYSALCKVYYRWRDVEPQALDKAIAACEASVAMAAKFNGKIGGTPVSHHCYGQLITIEKKRGNIDRAIELARKAASENWVGDWEHTIASLNKAKSRET